jgi:hypothetical protein
MRVGARNPVAVSEILLLDRPWGERCQNMPDRRIQESQSLGFYFSCRESREALPAGPFSGRWFTNDFDRGGGHQLPSLELWREGSIIASRSADRCRCRTARCTIPAWWRRLSVGLRGACVTVCNRYRWVPAVTALSGRGGSVPTLPQGNAVPSPNAPVLS